MQRQRKAHLGFSELDHKLTGQPPPDWASLHKWKRNLPLKTAFFGQSKTTARARDWKHISQDSGSHSTHRTWPSTPMTWLFCLQDPGESHGRRSQHAGCKPTSSWGRGSQGKVKFSTLYLPGGGAPRVPSGFPFRKLAFEVLPPPHKV